MLWNLPEILSPQFSSKMALIMTNNLKEYKRDFVKVVEFVDIFRQIPCLSAGATFCCTVSPSVLRIREFTGCALEVHTSEITPCDGPVLSRFYAWCSVSSEMCAWCELIPIVKSTWISAVFVFWNIEPEWFDFFKKAFDLFHQFSSAFFRGCLLQCGCNASPNSHPDSYLQFRHTYGRMPIITRRIRTVFFEGGIDISGSTSF